MNLGFIHSDKGWLTRAAVAVTLTVTLFAGPLAASLLPCCCTARASELQKVASCCRPAAEPSPTMPNCPAQGKSGQPGRCCYVTSDEAAPREARAVNVDDSLRLVALALPEVADDAPHVAAALDWVRPDLGRPMAPPVSILYGVWRN